MSNFKLPLARCRSAEGCCNYTVACRATVGHLDNVSDPHKLFICSRVLGSRKGVSNDSFWGVRSSVYNNIAFFPALARIDFACADSPGVMIRVLLVAVSLGSSDCIPEPAVPSALDWICWPHLHNHPCKNGKQNTSFSTQRSTN